MSSDPTVFDGTVTRCGWPACPSVFTIAPVAKGWAKISLSGVRTDQVLVLCPFHAVGHIPHMTQQGDRVTARCSCQGLIPCERDTLSTAFLDWRQHAREINDADTLVICQECLRGFVPSPTGKVRRHNAWDKMRGRLMSHTCPGAGLAPHSPEQR